MPNTELVHFTRVVMAMLVEQTPLPALPLTHQLYRSVDGPRLTVAAVVEKLRMLDAFRAQLPGVQEDFAYCRLGEREERVLRACIIGSGNARTLALPINVAQGFLGAVVRIAEHASTKRLHWLPNKPAPAFPAQRAGRFATSGRPEGIGVADGRRLAQPGTAGNSGTRWSGIPGSFATAQFHFSTPNRRNNRVETTCLSAST